jgi:signal peptidase I
MEAATRKLIRDYAGTVLGAVVVALLIRFYIIEAYRIPTMAMRPTLEPGDTVFVVKAPVGTKLFASEHPKPGDVILFHSEDPAPRDYIKRIVALPGETVELKKGKLWINGKAVNEAISVNSSCGTESLPGGKATGVCHEPPIPEDLAPIQVPNDTYFVLGDFRSLSQMDPSLKGRSWGMIPSSWIKGQALWVWLSVEPPSDGFPKFRFERMFRRIE